MPRMTNAKSAPILDEADKFLRQLRWMEFQVENTFNNYEGPGWTPGEPLYLRPHGWQYNQQTVRWMIEVIDDDKVNRRVRCRDCDVYWNGSDGCWVCGNVAPIFDTVPLRPNFHTDGDPEYDKSGLPTVERVEEKLEWANDYLSPSISFEQLENRIVARGTFTPCAIVDSVGAFYTAYFNEIHQSVVRDMFYGPNSAPMDEERYVDLTSPIEGAPRVDVRLDEVEELPPHRQLPDDWPEARRVDISNVEVRNLNTPRIDAVEWRRYIETPITMRQRDYH